MIPINLYSLPRQPAYEAFLWRQAGNYIANRTARKNRAVDMSFFERRRLG